MPLCIILCRFILLDADFKLVDPLLSVRLLSYLFCAALLLSPLFIPLCTASNRSNGFLLFFTLRVITACVEPGRKRYQQEIASLEKQEHKAE